MKRKIVSILLSATMVLGAVGLSACSNNELEAKIAELETQVTQLQEQNEELQNQISNLEQENHKLKEQIENYKSQISKFVDDATFYSLEDAYEKELLTKDDLLSIAYYHNGGREGNKELMPEDYMPQPKIVLSVDMELKIKYTYKLKQHDVPLDNIHIISYFGTYNKCVALRLADDYLTSQDIFTYDNYKIGKINFTNFTSIKVWCEL